ncbi:hypothetical protein METBIDRAFT_33089 [Metschnikowia bicuspidata var. bicuspidata NRRL YB-4993]|uniref:Uncharacterized protein n=1 Tax=Metschnikowia bicuspidata var. bicuspidata NRRL YB-4993 TaxID=869754 RepID=A0A1A0H837_9ASCO|nr:hypothetical protein METBIDRAFT_33089 [Metschnikowia bicuspidata var. bicuspidata NRRL YB-4993]OBA20150.1 hypothetical protein METBIDRAFT_33089 [Metschnikowia bicuspidata var. bicuspidata NRRL YB-4993]
MQKHAQLNPCLFPACPSSHLGSISLALAARVRRPHSHPASAAGRERARRQARERGSDMCTTPVHHGIDGLASH